MCIIIVKPKGVNLPDKTILKNCFSNNNDGAGFMFNSSDGMVHIKKGFMKFKPFYKSLLSADIRKKDTCIIHFRLGTHGLINPENCHPFPISSKIEDLKLLHCKTSHGIAHNGILQIEDIEDLSDTMIFISKKLSLLNPEDLFNPEIRDLIEKYSKTSKWSVLNGNGDYILYNGEWIKENGLVFSNNTYKYNRPKTISYVYNYHNDSYNYYEGSYYEWERKDLKWSDYKNLAFKFNEDRSLCPYCHDSLIDCNLYSYCATCDKEFDKY